MTAIAMRLRRHNASRAHVQIALAYLIASTLFILLFAGGIEPEQLHKLIFLQLIATVGPLLLAIVVPQQMSAPIVFYPIAYAAYFSLGGLGISSSFSQVSDEVYSLVIIGLAAFGGGCTIATLTVSGRAARPTHYCRSFIRSKLIAWSALVASSALLVHLFVVMKKGLIFLQPDFEEVRVTIVDLLGGYLTCLMFSTMDVVVVLLVYSIVKGWKRRSSLLMMVASILIVLPLHIGSRTRVLLPLLVVIVFYYLYNRRTIKLSVLVLLVAAITAVIGIVGAYRLQSVEAGAMSDLIMLKLISEGSLAAYTLDVLVTHVGQKSAFAPISVLFSPILSLLPGKQIVLDYYLKNSLGMTFVGGGFTPTIVGSFYVYGGNAAIILGMSCYGFLLTLAHKFYLRSRGAESRRWPVILFYSYQVVYALIGLKNGFFTSLEPNFHVAVALCLIVFSTALIKKTHSPPERVPDGAKEPRFNALG